MTFFHGRARRGARRAGGQVASRSAELMAFEAVRAAMYRRGNRGGRM